MAGAGRRRVELTLWLYEPLVQRASHCGSARQPAKTNRRWTRQGMQMTSAALCWAWHMKERCVRRQAGWRRWRAPPSIGAAIQPEPRLRLGLRWVGRTRPGWRLPRLATKYRRSRPTTSILRARAEGRGRARGSALPGTKPATARHITSILNGFQQGPASGAGAAARRGRNAFTGST